MIGQRYAQLLRVFRIALHDASDKVRTQVCKATLKEIAAKYFLWGDALGLQGVHLELQHFPSLQNQIERSLSTMADLIVHIFQPGFRHFVAHDLQSSANEATTGSFETAETGGSSSLATQHDEDAGAQYADHEMDQLLESIEFQLSCLLELSPSIARCTKHDDARSIPLPIVPASSVKGLHNTVGLPRTLEILEPRAPKELLDRLCNAKVRRDAHELHTDFGICTFDDCWAKYKVFEGAQWAHHEFSQHRFNRSWTCHVCQRVDVDESAWRRHLSAAHQIDLNKADMFLASQIACRVESRPIEQERCAFCVNYPAKTREEFEKHVGDHFKDACECIDSHINSVELKEPGSQTEEIVIPSVSSAPLIGTSLDTSLSSIGSSLGLPLPSRAPVGSSSSSRRAPVGSSSSSRRAPVGSSSSSRRAPVGSSSSSRRRTPFSAQSAQASASPSLELPPPETVEWRCENCQERPVMRLKQKTICWACNRKYDAYSIYYDRRGRQIHI